MFKDCVFWIGVVENNDDPQKRGRVQVRVFGAHDIYNPPQTDSTGRTSWGTSGGIDSGSGSSGSYGSMPTTSSNGSRLSIWQRYNNPMNLKNVNGSWRRFDDISQAYEAYYKQLSRYSQRGKVTPAQMITTWAPPNENKTQEYINNVNKWTGLDMNKPLDMNDYSQVAKLLHGMTRMESSLNFSEADIVSALQGNIVPSMTNKSSLYKDGQLYLGSSNAAEGVPNTPGDIPNTSSGTISSNAGSNAGTPNGTGPSSGSSSSASNNVSNNVVQKSGSLGTSSGEASGNSDSSGHKLPTEDLPWAICLYSPIEYGGTVNSTLPAPQVQNGAWVMGFSIDGDFMNQLFVIGVIPNSVNMAILSTNLREANTSAITGGGYSSGSSGSSRQVRNMPNVSVPMNGEMSFQQLTEGIWAAESSKGMNKKVSSAYCYGTMQIMPALAAGYLLQGDAANELEAAGLALTPETKEMLNMLRNEKNGSQNGYWGSQILKAQEKNPLVKDFCDLLQNNDSLNMAIGAAYLRDCGGSAQGNGDPVLTALYYNQGIPNVRRIMDAIGADSYNKIPDGMSYSEFISKVNTHMAGNNNFKIYTDNIFKGVGGVEALEGNRRMMV